MIAVRPHTLPAGVAPVVVGIGVAWIEDVFALWPALAALIGAVLIQIGTNLANDYFDAERGVDTADRTGFTRVTQAGLLAPERVKHGAALAFFGALVVGTYLVSIGGVPILLIGLASIVLGVTYAGGPLPFGSYGLGDLFVFAFFGLIAVTGTYYVQAVAVLGDQFPLWIPPGTISSAAVVASVSMGALTTAVLVVNNLRDIETDRSAGKYTLAVIIGRGPTKLEFIFLLLVAYLVPVWFVLDGMDWPVLLPFVTLPYAALVTHRVVWGPGGDALNRALERTGRLLALYAVMFVAGLLIA